MLRISMNSPFPLAKTSTSCVENPGFAPVFAALAANQAALHANLRSRGYWPKVVDLHPAGHGRQPPRANGLAHDLVQQRGDDAAMQVAGRTLETVRNRRKANHAPIFGKQKLEVQAGRIGRAAAKATVLAGVRHRG